MPSPAQVRGASRSLLGPLATFSGALWLRVTGVFFSVIALAMGNGAWRLRGALSRGVATTSLAGRHFWVFVLFGSLFAYFAVSSFHRATLRERRAAPRAS